MFSGCAGFFQFTELFIPVSRRLFYDLGLTIIFDCAFEHPSFSPSTLSGLCSRRALREPTLAQRTTRHALTLGRRALGSRGP